MVRSKAVLHGRFALLGALLISTAFFSNDVAFGTGLTTKSSERLSGSDVVHLAKPGWFPAYQDVAYLLVQGSDQGKDVRGDSVCSYGYDVTGKFDEAKPQFISVSAINLKTCEVELEIADLSRPFDPAVIGLKFEEGEPENGKQSPESRLGFALPGAVAQNLEPDPIPMLSNRDRKFTLLGFWADPQPVPNLRVNAVSVAVRAYITDDEVVDVGCKFGYDWLDETSWRRITSGQWDERECHDRGLTRAVGFTNAAYFNDHFCATNDTWVYYDKMRVTIWSDRGGDDWHSEGIRDTWGTGLCVDINLIRFDGFATYPNEYWKISHTD